MTGSMQIILRAMSEPDYRELLFADFERAVEGIELDDAERTSLKALTRHGFDRVVGGMMAHMLIPIRASKRVVVTPALQPAPADPGDVVVRLTPKLAFGSGAHESTRASLAALEEHLRPGDRMLDLGSGSGILSIAAIGLGASQGFALDINPAAVDTARENVRLNKLGDRVRVEVGSLADVLSNRFGLPETTFDLVTANILPHVLLDFIRQGIAQVLRPGGRLIVAGMQQEHVRYIARVLPATGLEEVDRRDEGQWPALVLRRKERHVLEGIQPGWQSRLFTGSSIR